MNKIQDIFYLHEPTSGTAPAVPFSLEISMAHLIDSMAYTGQTPWHGLGNVLPPQQSLDVWLQAAGMDWTIEQSDVLYQGSPDNPILHTYPDSKVLYRSDTIPPCRWSHSATTWYSPMRCCTSIKIWWKWVVSSWRRQASSKAVVSCGPWPRPART